MSDFKCKVVKIDVKENHPNANKLTIYKIGEYTCISNKLEDGSDRYNIGDLVVYIPKNSIVPNWLLKRMNLWDDEKNYGMLAGKDGNLVKPFKLRGIFSEGILYPVKKLDSVGCIIEGKPYGMGDSYAKENSYAPYIVVNEGDDVASFLGIINYE